MGTIDPALGIAADFDADGFREAIHFAMQMGAAPDAELRPTFVFPSSSRTYSRAGNPLDPTTVLLDQDGNPLDPEVTMVEGQPTKRQVDCAVEIVQADAREMPVGNFRPVKAIVTLLDVEYAQAKGCREMIYNGDRYLFGYEPDVVGMFDVGVNTLIFYAIDES